MEFNLYTHERNKGKAWIKNLVRHYHSIGSGNVDFKVDKECWDLYHNKVNPARFNYLLKVGNYSLPARPRHIPLQKHLIDSLSSQQRHRPFVFSLVVTNEEAIKDKGLKLLREFIDKVWLYIHQKHYGNIQKINSIDQKMMQLRQMMEQKPESQEAVMEQQQIKMQLPQIETVLTQMKEQIEMDDKVDQDTMNEYERYYRYGNKDIKEELAEKVMRKLRSSLNVKRKSTLNFISQCVTGKQYYYVDYIQGDRFPRYETLDTTKVLYPKIPGIRWIQDGPWVVIKEKLSYQQVLVEFGGDLKKEYGEEVLKKLSSTAMPMSSSNSTFVSTPEGGVLYEGPYSGTFENAQGLEVSRVFVKVPRKVYVKYSPNPHQSGKYFRHFIDKNKIIIDETDYTYQNEKYIGKREGMTVLNRKDVEPYNPLKDQSVNVKYTNDIYMGVVIEGNYLVSCKKKDEVYRGLDNHDDVKLPVVGPSYSSMAEQPYSLIYSTRDLQELYDIVYTMRELMVALSGTKTIIADKGQKPGDLEQDEHEYQKKLGTFWIETFDPVSGVPKRSNFNQWSMVDLSLSSSAKNLSDMLRELEETMGNIIGVPRPRQGQVVNTDQVGTFKESIKRAHLITEILYNDHDEVETQALKQLVNLSIKYCYKDSTDLEINDIRSGSDIFHIPAGIFNEIEFDVNVENNTEQAQQLQDVKDLMLGAWNKGQVPFQAMLESWNADTVVGLAKKVEYFTEKAEKIRQESMGAEQQNKIDLQREKIKFAQEFEGYWKNMQIEIDKMKLELEKAKMESDKNIDEREIALKEKDLEYDTMLRTAELANEQRSEDNVIANNDKHATIDETLRVLEMQLNNLYNMATLKSKEKEGIKKLEVEKTKAKKIVKEHASDK